MVTHALPRSRLLLHLRPQKPRQSSFRLNSANHSLNSQTAPNRLLSSWAGSTANGEPVISATRHHQQTLLVSQMYFDQGTALFREYRRFISRGNVVDLAVAFVLGASFTVIVKSLVSDVLMPPITMILGDTALANKFVILKDGAEAGPYVTLAAAKQAGAVTLNYGLFIDGVVAFLLVGFATFMIVRYMKRAQDRFDKAEIAAAPTTKNCQFCHSAINIDATKCAFCTSELSAESA